MTFTLMRPSGREVWSTEDWRAAVIQADWLRRQKRVERDYERARVQILEREFQAAWDQRVAKYQREAA